MSKVIGRGRYATETYPEAGAAGNESVEKSHAQYTSGSLNPAAINAFDAPGFTTRTGKVRVTAGINPSLSDGTSVAGNDMYCQLRLETVALDPTSGANGIPAFVTEMGSTYAGPVTLEHDFLNLVPGTTYVFGIQATNLTTAGTSSLDAGGAFVQIQDIE